MPHSWPPCSLRPRARWPMPLEAKDSPCRGFCTTALGDDVCRSCGRTFEEVTGWIGYSEEQKQACWERLIREGWVDLDRTPLRGK
ncbi:DUF1289 domain-containing protein [Acidithiobacillus caldus]|nr:DUF1289 domain-containing protein [Acidithiobacillus caldus]